MSVRVLVQRYIQYVQNLAVARVFAQPLHPVKFKVTSLNKIHFANVGEGQSHVPVGAGNFPATGKHLSFLGAQARRLFANNILKRVTSSLTSNLRKKAVSRLIYGDSAPFFALVGVSLASGGGILTKEDELEGICWEIREAVQKMQWNKPHNDKKFEPLLFEDSEVSINDFVIGPPIAKGSSAIVHAVRAKTVEESEQSTSIKIDKFGSISSFPLALKMMFNYDAESNATSILRSMYKETVPAWKHHHNGELSYWEQRMAENYISLPPHPNVVAMYRVFADRVPLLPSSSKLYPDALPPRLNPEGSGRNMSLFLLMKRYDTTLKQYLADTKCDTRESILIFAQLLEGIYHINSNRVAHRDLKTDNILLDLSEENESCPSLVITDFGCCSADKNHGLCIPYNSHDIDKGGNSALMAPEIITTEPGPFTRLDFSKSDLWTAGAIAYEIFGTQNPFYSSSERPALSNYNYKEEDLPELPEFVPNVVLALVRNMLRRNPSKRLSVDYASSIMHLYLWAPSAWLQPDTEIPSYSEVMQWVLCLTSKILYEVRLNSNDGKNYVCNESKISSYKRSLSTRSSGRRTMPEYQLIACFLSRVSLNVIRDCIKWIKNHA